MIDLYCERCGAGLPAEPINALTNAAFFDEAACPYIPTGTHFLWHVLIAVVLYLSMRALILNWPMRIRQI